MIERTANPPEPPRQRGYAQPLAVFLTARTTLA